ncbi:MAG: hypothetical protein KF846_01390 [Cyclobacteriaceae bacterium]|nr:hypothetical protein [Cyclobacteriaceae bacterium]MBX2954779.1 hypothetical protein [Cyclobacteriaceae bacterium]
MAVEKDLDLLDDYLSNRMGEQDKVAFEQKLEANPELQKEMQLQQQLVEGIRKQRALELKTMLNNVPVASGTGGQTALFTKVVSSVIVAGLVTTAVYWYFTDSEPAESIVSKTEEVEEPTEEANLPEEPPVIEEKAEEKKSASSSAEVTTPAAEVTKPKLDIYTPESAEESANLQKEHDQIAFITKAFVTSSVEVDVESGNKKYNFHYIFRGGKLVLYGSFENNLYEILEFISENKRTVFLYYKTSYYLLDEQVETPTLLVPIRDAKLIKKLKEHRAD